MASRAITNKPLLSDLVGKVSSTHTRPVGDRPDLAHVDNESGAGIPLIDLKMLNADGPERRKVVEAIGRACESHGFFMVTNHGIAAPVMEEMLSVAREFFHLQKVSNWREFLRLQCYPHESLVDQWPSNPPSFRKVVGTYATEARALALRLMEAISESLSLERSHMVAAMGQHAQHMAVNYYPPCPQAEPTYGLPGHKDPNAITLLLQDGVSGLQVQRGGRWVAVNPVPNALVINIGDMMQALSNDRYKSVLHRVIVNSKSEGISVRTFLCPSPYAVIAPANALVDNGHPPAYRPFTYQEYCEFLNMGVQTVSCLDRFRPGGSMDLNKLNGPERKSARWLQKSGGSKPVLPLVDLSRRQPAESSSIPISEVPPGESGSFPPTPSFTATRTPSSSIGENAAPAATTTDREDTFLIAINAITFALLGFIKLKDITSSWQTEWKVLYGIFFMLAVLSAAISIFTAWFLSTRKTSFFFASLGLLVAIALDGVNIFFQMF